jgi:hypothetical protein
MRLNSSTHATLLVPLRMLCAARSEYGPHRDTGDEDRRLEPRPCEDCGSDVVSGLEPFARDDALSGGTQTDSRYERSDWCTDPDCPSNQLRGLRRTGVNDYQCLERDAVVRTPFTDVAAHRRGYTGQSDEPGTYSYT